MWVFLGRRSNISYFFATEYRAAPSWICQHKATGPRPQLTRFQYFQARFAFSNVLSLWFLHIINPGWTVEEVKNWLSSLGFNEEATLFQVSLNWTREIIISYTWAYLSIVTIVQTSKCLKLHIHTASLPLQIKNLNWITSILLPF